MRIVLRVDEEIPGLAVAGSYITIRLVDRVRPVSVTVEHGPEALRLLADHYRSVRPCDEVPGEDALRVLYRILGHAVPKIPKDACPRLVK